MSDSPKISNEKIYSILTVNPEYYFLINCQTLPKLVMEKYTVHAIETLIWILHLDLGGLRFNFIFMHNKSQLIFFSLLFFLL